MKKNRTLGSLCVMGLQGLNSIIIGDLESAIRLVWFVWFIYFMPKKK